MEQLGRKVFCRSRQVGCSSNHQRLRLYRVIPPGLVPVLDPIVGCRSAASLPAYRVNGGVGAFTQVFSRRSVYDVQNSFSRLQSNGAPRARPGVRSHRCPGCTHGCLLHPRFEVPWRGPAKPFRLQKKLKKTIILFISGPRDLLETIPRAISDRMVRVSFILVASRATLGQNKVPRTLSTVCLC